MLVENNIFTENEMNTKIKNVENFLHGKLIFCQRDWIKGKIILHKNVNNINEIIYDEIIKSDIYSFIDQNKVNDYCNYDDNFKFDIKLKNMDKNIFLQILGYRNIAEPIEKNKDSNNLDVLDNVESKFLQSDIEETKKVEKIVMKFQFTDGVNIINGFEYEKLENFRNKLNNLSSESKYAKVILGPKFEVRRGIVFLKNNNITLL